MTCTELHAGMMRLFAAPGYTYMQEVRNATGFDSNRSADAMALGMYQSRGRELWGFEMKVSRSDWVKELEQADKSEAWMQYCDRWALVIADATMVHAGELPSTWGLYAPVKGKLKCITPCPKLTPRSLTRTALTALIYASQQVDKDAQYKLINQAVEESKKHYYDKNQRDAEAYRELTAKVQAFADLTGINIQYAKDERLKDIGAAVNLILHGESGIKRRMQTIEYAVDSVKGIVPELEKQLEVLRAAQAMEGMVLNED